MDSQRAVTTELSRDLNLFHLTMMGLGMMIGAGVFLGIGNTMHFAGPGGVLLTFSLNSLLALFSAMSYAELSSAIPRAGGAYNFARIGFGRGTSFMAGWMEWFASSVAGSMYAVAFGIYTVRYLEGLGLLSWLTAPSLLVKPVAAAIALFFLFINYRGASETGRVGAAMTAGQTLFLIFIGAVGLAVAVRDPSRLANFRPFLPYGWSPLFMTMGFTYVAFEGFEVIAQAGDEAIEPKRNLPKAMLYSVYAVGLTYLLVAFATVVAVKSGSPGTIGEPWQWIASHRERGFGEAVARLLPAGNFLLTLAVIFASTSALNATIRAPEGGEYRIMVPIANPANALSIVWHTHRLASARRSRIKLLHMVPVPDQVFLRDAEKYLLDGREGIVEAMLYLVQRFPITTTIRYCRNIARGIVSAVREKKIDLLIMGWHGRRQDRRFKLGSTLDPVLSRSPCNVVILKDCGSRSFGSVLVPLFGNGNDAFALQVARSLVEPRRGRISVLPVRAARGGRRPGALARYTQRLLRQAEIPAGKVRVLPHASGDSARAVLQRAAPNEAAVVGLRASWLRRVGVAAPPEQVARQWPGPLVMIKAARGLGDWAKRWL